MPRVPGSTGTWPATICSVAVRVANPKRSCSRRMFAERFDGAVAHYARRSNDATDLLTTFALQAGGEGGARLACNAGVPISPDTLLRILHELTDAEDTRGPKV